jgi:AhpD family alkylhydroperoxidase
MSYLASPPERPVLLDVFRALPRTASPLLEYHEALLRGPYPPSVAEREPIAAYVSGLNACHHCHRAHAGAAARFGIDNEHLASVLSDLDAASVDESLKSLLGSVRTLTETPAKTTASDAEAVSVGALFNRMNRRVDGLGIHADDAYFRQSSGRPVDRSSSGCSPCFPSRANRAEGETARSRPDGWRLCCASTRSGRRWRRRASGQARKACVGCSRRRAVPVRRLQQAM